MIEILFRMPTEKFITIDFGILKVRLRLSTTSTTTKYWREIGMVELKPCKEAINFE